MLHEFTPSTRIRQQWSPFIIFPTPPAPGGTDGLICLLLGLIVREFPRDAHNQQTPL
jgi:hypothetical protein